MKRRSFRERLKVDLPEGECGDWSIKHFEVSSKAAAFERMRAIIKCGRGVPEGHYTGLYYRGSTIMSDTPDEMRDHMIPIVEAQRRGGHVLINGLGLGMVAAAILNAEARCESCMQYPDLGICDCSHTAGEPERQPIRYAVDKVTVIEKAPEVVALVARTLKARYGDRLEIVTADAYEYKPAKGERFSVVWHDVWGTLCTDNLKEMGTLHRRYGRRCDWQGSWGRELLKRMQRREKREERDWGW